MTPGGSLLTIPVPLSAFMPLIFSVLLIYLSVAALQAAVEQQTGGLRHSGIQDSGPVIEEDGPTNIEN